MAKRKVIEPSALRTKRRRRKNLKIIFWTLLVVVIVLGLGFLTHLKAMTVNNIVVEGNNSISSNDLIKIARTDMAGNFYLFFSKSNVFLYPRTQIKNDILNQYKQIGGLSIKQIDFQSLRLSLSERKPEALWCQNSGGETITATTTTPAIASISANCYFMDQTGYIFAAAPDFSGNLYFTYYGLLGSDNPIGKNYLSSAKFKDLSNFLDNLKKLGLSFDSLTASDENDFELTLSDGAKILFTDSQPFDQTLSNLETVIDKNNPSGNSLDLSKVQYVDLRFGNKIFYKLKDKML